MQTRYGMIKRVPYSKYLGKLIEPTGSEKAHNISLQKIKKSFGLVQNIHNKLACQDRPKFGTTTIVKSAILYKSKTLTLNESIKLNISKKKRGK